MNQDQKKYLLKRIEEIQRSKDAELILGAPAVSIAPFLEKLKVNVNLLQIGKESNKLKAKLFWEERLPSINTYNSYISFTEAEFFINFNKVKNEYNEAVKKSRSLIDKRKAVLNDYVVSLKDEIMLGDSKKALEELAKFEKMKF